MKSFWSLAAKFLLVIVLIQAWFLYDMHRQNTVLLSANEEYSAYLEDSEAKITQLQAQLAETEKKTVDGILKETNKAVIQGWESLLNKVEEELEKAKEVLPELLEPEAKQELPLDSQPQNKPPKTNTSPSLNDDDENTIDKDSSEPSSDPEKEPPPPVLIPTDIT